MNVFQILTEISTKVLEIFNPNCTEIIWYEILKYFADKKDYFSYHKNFLRTYDFNHLPHINSLWTRLCHVHKTRPMFHRLLIGKGASANLKFVPFLPIKKFLTNPCYSFLPQKFIPLS